MQYSIYEKPQPFILHGEVISDITVVILVYTSVLDQFYQNLQAFQKPVHLIYDDAGNFLGYEVYYAKISNETIFEMLKTQKKINLDEYFIQDFSLQKYAEYCGKELNQCTMGELHFPKDFSATLSFWEGDTSFSRSQWLKVEFNFFGAFFGGKSIDFSGMVIEQGFLDLSRIYVSEGVYFSLSYIHIKQGDIYIISAHLDEGERDFFSIYLDQGSLKLSQTNIEGGKIDFSYSKIYGVWYCNNLYCKNLSWNVVDLLCEGIDFSSSEFRQSVVYIYDSTIGDKLKNFSELYLCDSCFSMAKTNFGNGRIDFSYSEIHKSELNLQDTVFKGDTLDCSYIICNGAIIFSRAEFFDTTLLFIDSMLDLVSFDSINSQGYINFHVQKCRMLSLKNAFISGIFDLSPKVKLEYLQLVNISLSGSLKLTWFGNNIPNAIGNMIKEEKKHIAENFSASVKKQKIHQLSILQADVFRILKENFNANRHYDDEDRSYIEHRRALWKTSFYHASIFKRITLFFEWLFLDLFGAYGTDPWRAWLGIIMIWAGFAGLYYYFDDFYIGNSVDINRLGRAMYHSAITFFTIGYGDIVPRGDIMRTLSGLEGFVGVIFTSYFMVAFTKKTLR